MSPATAAIAIDGRFGLTCHTCIVFYVYTDIVCEPSMIAGRAGCCAALGWSVCAAAHSSAGSNLTGLPTQNSIQQLETPRRRRHTSGLESRPPRPLFPLPFSTNRCSPACPLPHDSATIPRPTVPTTAGRHYSSAARARWLDRTAKSLPPNRVDDPISALLLEWLRNAVQPPGSMRTPTRAVKPELVLAALSAPGGSACCYWNGYGAQCYHPAQGLACPRQTRGAAGPSQAGRCVRRSAARWCRSSRVDGSADGVAVSETNTPSPSLLKHLLNADCHPTGCAGTVSLLNHPLRFSVGTPAESSGDVEGCSQRSHLGVDVRAGLDEQPDHLPRAGWISLLLLEWLRNAVEPLGSTDLPRGGGTPRRSVGQSGYDGSADERHWFRGKKACLSLRCCCPLLPMMTRLSIRCTPLSICLVLQ